MRDSFLIPLCAEDLPNVESNSAICCRIKTSGQPVCAALRVKETIRAEELSLGEWERLSQLLQPVTAQHGGEKFCVVDAQDRVIGSESRAIGACE